MKLVKNLYDLKKLAKSYGFDLINSLDKNRTIEENQKLKMLILKIRNISLEYTFNNEDIPSEKIENIFKEYIEGEIQWYYYFI